MGLDLYAGTLTRYYSGNWKTINQEVLGTRIVYANGQTPWISEGEAVDRVGEFKGALRQALAKHDVTFDDWDERPSISYLSNQPTREGLDALILWAAYIHRPDLKRPLVLPVDIESDRAYAESNRRNYYEPELATLEAHIFVPSDLQFMTVLPSPLGAPCFIATTGGLAQTLLWINDNSWKATPGEFDQWGERGLPADEVAEIQVEEEPSGLRRLLSWRSRRVQSSPDRLQQAAQYAFAAYSRMLTFSIENNVPIVRDE